MTAIGAGIRQPQGTSTVEDTGQRIVKYALTGQDGPTGKVFFTEKFTPET